VKANRCNRVKFYDVSFDLQPIDQSFRRGQQNRADDFSSTTRSSRCIPIRTRITGRTRPTPRSNFHRRWRPSMQNHSTQNQLRKRGHGSLTPSPFETSSAIAVTRNCFPIRNVGEGEVPERRLEPSKERAKPQRRQGLLIETKEPVFVWETCLSGLSDVEFKTPQRRILRE